MKKARSDYFFRMLRDPATDRIPAQIRYRELAYAKSLAAHSFGKQTALNFDWKEAGPVDVGGRTRGLAVDRANANVLMAGGATGGIWKSTNQGASWTLKSDPSLSITSLAQDPRTGQTATWYAATGEYSGSGNDFSGAASYFGTGLYKSTDNGETWNVVLTDDGDPTTQDARLDFATRVAVSPTTGTVFVATNGYGVFRSTDGGATLGDAINGTDVLEHEWSDVAVASDGTVIAALSSGFVASANLPGIYASFDDGVTWDDITPGTFPDPSSRTVVAFAPSNPDVAYAMTWSGEGTGPTEEIYFYKLTPSTGDAEDRSANLPNFGGDGYVNTQGAYNMLVTVKPDDENFVLIGATNLFRSRDGFATPADDLTENWIGGYATANDVSLYLNQHPDQHATAFDPSDPDRLYSGHDGGLSVVADLTTEDDELPWVKLNNGYNVSQYYHIAIPQEAGDPRITGGLQDNGSPFYRFDGTTTSTSNDISSGDGAFAHFGANYIFASAQMGAISIYHNDPANDPNFETTYLADVTPQGATDQLFITPYVVDPNNDNIVYYPAGGALWRSNLGDVTQGELGWASLDNVSAPADYVYTALGISSSPAGVLYLGASGEDAPRIFRLDNADTATDGEVERSIPGAAEGAYIHNIAVNPANADEILVVFSNYNVAGLYHSTDGGQTYTAVESNLEGDAQHPGPSLRSATILPYDGETTYVLGTSIGAFATSQLDGANTQWTQIATDLVGNTVTASVTSRTSDGTVVLGTHGRGAFVGTPMAAANQAPAFITALPDTTINAGIALAFTYVATDPDGDPLGYSFTEAPQDATLDDNTGVFAWTPTAAGDFTITVEVSDGTLSTSTTATVTVLGGTAVEEEGGLPRVFALHPNYPNPFNPETTIPFDVPKNGPVEVAVFDLQGRQVAVLVNGTLSAGRHQARWQAADTPSGTYFVQMRAGNVTTTRKVLLVK